MDGLAHLPEAGGRAAGSLHDLIFKFNSGQSLVSHNVILGIVLLVTVTYLAWRLLRHGELVWWLRHGNSAIRDYPDGTPTDRYALFDDNPHITALLEDSSGSTVAKERYAYDPHGKVRFLTAAFSEKTVSESDFGMEVLFTAIKFKDGVKQHAAR